MSKKEKKIKLSGIDLLNFTGVNDGNIELIRENFNAIVVVRGENVIIKGDAEEVKEIEKLINELMFLQKRQGSISRKDVELVLSLLSNEVEDAGFKNKFGIDNSDIGNIILHKKNNFVKPRSSHQYDYLNSVNDNDIVFAIGPAGTGKTYLAVAFAVRALKDKLVNKIILARPAVEAGESLGFLPGDLTEKVNPYLKPLFDALEDILPYEKLKSYLEKNIIEIVPLAYMRGRTLNNAFVILDEAQNSTTMQMKMFLTRLGANSKSIITGDITQIDLPKREYSGLIQAREILKGIDGIGFVYFDKSDVIRHKLVQDIIEAYDKYNNN